MTAYALKPGGVRVLEVDESDTSVTLRLEGRSLGQHALVADGAPVVLSLPAGRLELSWVTVFGKPHLRLTLDGAPLPGTAFHRDTHRTKALQRGLLTVASLTATFAFFLAARRTEGLVLSGCSLFTALTSLWWIRNASRVATSALVAAGIVSSIALLRAFDEGAAEALFGFVALSTYDVLFVFADRTWLEHLDRT